VRASRGHREEGQVHPGGEGVRPRRRLHHSDRRQRQGPGLPPGRRLPHVQAGHQLDQGQGDGQRRPHGAVHRDQRRDQGPVQAAAEAQDEGQRPGAAEQHPGQHDRLDTENNRVPEQRHDADAWGRHRHGHRGRRGPQLGPRGLPRRRRLGRVRDPAHRRPEAHGRGGELRPPLFTVNIFKSYNIESIYFL